MRYGKSYPQKHDLTSLKIIGSVGEPLNPEAWHWYHQYIGGSKAKLVDTYWQTETGGHLITTPPHLPQKTGVAGLPFYGINAQVVDIHGNSVPSNQKGHLVISSSWPGALTSCWQDPDRFQKYFHSSKKFFYTGDYAIKDDEGYIQILGRSDDLINISGHRIGSAEIENILATRPEVAEAAAIGVPDELTGESLKIFTVLNPSHQPSQNLSEDLINFIKITYGKHAHVQSLEFIDVLPKTRSGKIMRRLLKARELGEQTGDTSTLED
jgi:acetyl-CoA synthetase